jgi:hypothetical protein
MASSNGTELKTRPSEGELGSAWSDIDRVFGPYDNGKVFTPVWDLFERNIDRMLDLDGKARALEQVLTLPLTWAPYSIKPADGDNGEAEFVREWLFRPSEQGGMSTPLELVIAQMSSAVLYRRAFFELVWRVEGDGLVFDKLAYRPARTCQIARDPDTYAFQGFRQRFRKKDEYVTRDIPAEKSMVLLHGQHRDPLQGVSDLKTAYTCFETKQKVRYLWVTFLERQAVPSLLAKDNTNDETSAKKFARRLLGLKDGGVAGIGQEQEVTVLESSGTAAATFASALEYLDHEMFASCLAGFADLAGAAASGTGSFALSRDQSDFFLRSRKGTLKEMANCLTHYAIAPLVRWNFGVDARCPVFEFGDLNGTDAKAAIDLFQTLTSAQTPSPLLNREFMDLLTVQVSGFLGLEADKVKAAIDAQPRQEPGQVGDLHAGVSAAVRLVQEAGVGQPAAAVAATNGAG